MRAVFRAATASQFLIHGAIFDFVPVQGADGKPRLLSLTSFLEDVMFARFEVVVRYDRGTGITVTRGLEDYLRFLKGFDDWNNTSYARSPASVPRDPAVALTLLDRFLDYCAQNNAIEGGQLVRKPIRIALIIDYAHFLAPIGDTLQVSGRYGDALIRLLDWANDPMLVDAHATTVLLTENLADLHPALSGNPYAAKVEIKLPTQAELLEFLGLLVEQEPGLKDALQLEIPVIAQRLVGLSRVNMRNALQHAVRNGNKIDAAYLVTKRRELIEKECRGLLDFIESDTTLDAVAGHGEVRAWLRDDAKLLRLGLLRSVPMGYLLCGRIGTGKTYITTAWAGEIGIPCVVFKNFRDKWQGSTEGNLEKIFTILKALGQVLVFIDEADQATGKRDSGSNDGGVAGRVYSMLAKEMSDTRNRGKIVWVFATSRPDLVEVDLKRPGRLDVHIPLFPPETDEERDELFKSLAKKVGISAQSLPTLATGSTFTGNEMEALLVRARRQFDLQDGKKKQTQKAIVEAIVADFRPMSHRDKLELMDLVAVKECTDTRFLPARYRAMALEEIDARIDALKIRLREP
jgi:AAA+ superfamily predicted ATPase